MHLPVEGMESVLATVTGYHGAQRFNLIKLISHAGGSFVGNMSPSVSHLVCWKYEGRKYELAKKLKMVIVNHRWVEECVKTGWRVSEKPFTYQCGEEVGPLLLEIPREIHLAKINQSKALKNSKLPVIDIDCEETNNAAWTDSILFDEINDFTIYESQNAPRKIFHGEEKHKARQAASEDLSEVSPPLSPPSRHEVWKRARITVNGKYTSSEVSDVAEKTAHSYSEDDFGVVRIRWA